jgi:hypothetical protein
MKSRSLFTLMVILFFSVIVGSQEIEGEKSFVTPVPEIVMHQVVRRILVYNFKPVNRRKVVYLSKQGINQSWLPAIPNIEFRLLSDEEIEDKGTGIYFFTKPELSKRTYDIGFAFGNPDCEYTGETWRFRVAENKVRLWQGGFFGGFCNGWSDDQFKAPGQLNNYPNELEGYRFFDRGKLKGIRLTISTREDVKNSFGADCESVCDYNQNWEVRFTYFNDFHRETTVKDKRVKIVSKEEYADKLYSITLSPKSEILFDKVIFPPKFKKSTVYTAAHYGSGGGTNSTHDIYTDRFGLKYSVLVRISLTTIKNLKWRKGELTSIEYTIPDKLEEKMFAEQK